MKNLKVSTTDIVLKEEERQACEVWTRVMGYHRPLASFNIGKKGEYAERKFFIESSVNFRQENSYDFEDCGSRPLNNK